MFNTLITLIDQNLSKDFWSLSNLIIFSTPGWSATDSKVFLRWKWRKYSVALVEQDVTILEEETSRGDAKFRRWTALWRNFGPNPFLSTLRSLEFRSVWQPVRRNSSPRHFRHSNRVLNVSSCLAESSRKFLYKKVNKRYLNKKYFPEKKAVFKTLFCGNTSWLDLPKYLTLYGVYSAKCKSTKLRLDSKFRVVLKLDYLRS